jgi:hypothetical protein
MYGEGVYQRTKDGKTLVWNNYPRPGDEATWSGKRDADGYATGHGTLTWFGVVTQSATTGSNIPAKKRAVALGRYTGDMVQGKFDGPVLNVDANGKIFNLTFVNGARATAANARPSLSPQQAREERVERKRSVQAPAEERVERKRSVEAPAEERVERKRSVEAPAEGPSPSPREQKPKKPASGGVIVEAPTGEDVSPEEATPEPPSSSMTMAALATPRPTVAPPPPALSQGKQRLKDQMISELKQQTDAVLSQVGEATGNFQKIDRFDSVQRLPVPVSETIGSLADRARELRSKLGSEAAPAEYQAETETAEALSVVDQITSAIANNDASEASSKVTGFLKSNPGPIVEDQKPLWGYLNSVQSLCSRLEKEADVHLQRAQSLAAAGKTTEAIQEYQQAYGTFPNPAIAAKIRQLQDNSLGL